MAKRKEEPKQIRELEGQLPPPAGEIVDRVGTSSELAPPTEQFPTSETITLSQSIEVRHLRVPFAALAEGTNVSFTLGKLELFQLPERDALARLRLALQYQQATVRTGIGRRQITHYSQAFWWLLETLGETYRTHDRREPFAALSVPLAVWENEDKPPLPRWLKVDPDFQLPRPTRIALQSLRTALVNQGATLRSGRRIERHHQAAAWLVEQMAAGN